MVLVFFQFAEGLEIDICAIYFSFQRIQYREKIQELWPVAILYSVATCRYRKCETAVKFRRG